MRLRFADSLNVMRSRTRLKFGDRGFSAAAPDAWNSLPTHVKSAPSLDSFTDRLKTELFKRSYVYRRLGCSYVIVVRQLVIDSYV